MKNDIPYEYKPDIGGEETKAAWMKEGDTPEAEDPQVNKDKPD